MNTKVLILDYSAFEREKIKYILNNIGGFSTIEIENMNKYYNNVDNYTELAFIIMDLAFPFESDGFHILENLRRNSSTKNTPIIITTKTDNLEYKKTALQHAVNDYIIKPYSVKRLESSISSILKVDHVFTYKVSNKNKITMSYEDYIIKEIKTCSRVKQPLSIIFTTPLSTITSKEPLKPFDKETEKSIFSNAAEKIKNVLRATDTVIVNDNNDILTILPFTDSKNAKIVYEKSREKISEFLKNSNVNFEKYFYSVIVNYPDDGVDFQSLMGVVSKKITDKKLLEKIVSIPVDISHTQYSKNKYTDFKRYS